MRHRRSRLRATVLDRDRKFDALAQGMDEGAEHLSHGGHRRGDGKCEALGAADDLDGAMHVIR